MEQLKEKYAERDVAFVAMYVREPHAEERGFRGYTNHESYEHKLGYAKELIDIKGLTMPVVVDGMDQTNHEMLGNLPNIVYVVDKHGIVHHRDNWLLADDVDAVLAELVTADDPSRPVVKTIDTSGLDASI